MTKKSCSDYPSTDLLSIKILLIVILSNGDLDSVFHGQNTSYMIALTYVLSSIVIVKVEDDPQVHQS